MREEIRILGVDDSYFSRSQKEVLVIGVVFRGGDFIDNVLSCAVEVDGIDATYKLVQMIKNSKVGSQLRCILLDGIAFGGFNVVNINSLYEETKIPVIVVIRKMPDFERIKKALTNLSDGDKRLEVMESAGKVYEYEVKHKILRESGIIYYQKAGITEKEAEKILKLTTTRSLIPEPVRVAHLVGQGIVLGESRGRV
jgi:endonuclease V-like protein UPF0215 family